jgi:hypothetical protein
MPAERPVSAELILSVGKKPHPQDMAINQLMGRVINRLGQAVDVVTVDQSIGDEGTAQTPAEQLEQDIFQYLGDKDTPQAKAFSHRAEGYFIDAKAAITGENSTRKRVENQRKINQGLGDEEYRTQWTHINRKIPAWHRVFTQGITDSRVREFAFAQKLVDIKNRLEVIPSQQPPPSQRK